MGSMGLAFAVDIIIPEWFSSKSFKNVARIYKNTVGRCL